MKNSNEYMKLKKNVILCVNLYKISKAILLLYFFVKFNYQVMSTDTIFVLFSVLYISAYFFEKVVEKNLQKYNKKNEIKVNDAFSVASSLLHTSFWPISYESKSIISEEEFIKKLKEITEN